MVGYFFCFFLMIMFFFLFIVAFEWGSKFLRGSGGGVGGEKRVFRMGEGVR